MLTLYLTWGGGPGKWGPRVFHRPLIVVQFIYHSNSSGCSECLEPKGCPRKVLFLTQGSNSKVQFAKFQFKKQLSFLKYVLFKPKNANILEIRVHMKTRQKISKVAISWAKDVESWLMWKVSGQWKLIDKESCLTRKIYQQRKLINEEVN